MNLFCEGGKPCHCAYHTHQQHLFYEFVNLKPLDWARIADALGLPDATPDSGHPAAFWARCAQDAGLLPELWRAVKHAGGDLRGACPLF